MRSLIAGVVLLAYLKLAGKKLVVNRLTLTVGFAVMLKFVCFTVGNKLTSERPTWWRCNTPTRSSS